MKAFRRMARNWAGYVGRDSSAWWGSLLAAGSSMIPFGFCLFLFMPAGDFLKAGVMLAIGVQALMAAVLLFERAGFVELLKERDKVEQKSRGSLQPDSSVAC